ncbi:MAG TPA: hypothetical protein VH054_18970 [Polyangiaceae bacterium]|jgi:hypothetical protein|nr:hypothetical protein [Polyangiaceae bacterium]
MMFRQAAPRTWPKGHVVHGPFPARMRFFGFAFAALFIGALCTWMALHTERLACPAKGVCTIDGRPRFQRANLRDVRIERRKGSKSSEHDVVVFDLASGTRIESMQLETDDGNDAVLHIQGALASGQPWDETLTGPRFLAPFGIAGMLASLLIVFFAFSKMGHFDLIVDEDAQTLRVKRSLFLVPLGTKTVSLDRVERVELGHGAISPGMRQRYEKEIPACRLVLVRRDGELVPLSKAIFPGHALHLRAAAALRTALALEPNAKDDEELARIPMRHWDLGSRFGFAWGGVTTGSMIGAALFGLTLAVLGWINPRANIEGWMMGIGGGLGALGGAGVVFHYTRTRLPR